MTKEVFIVKNITTNDIELKDFGIIIPPNDSIDLIDFEEAYMSEELELYINNNQLVRIINGEEVTLDDAFKDNIPNFQGPVSFLYLTKPSNQNLTTTLETVTYNTNIIDNNAFNYLTVTNEIEFKTNSKFLILSNYTVNQTAGNTRSDTIHKLQYDNGTGYVDIPGGTVYNYSRGNAQGKETSTIISVLDVSVGDKIKSLSAINSGTATIELLGNGTNLIVSNILGQPGPEGLPGIDGQDPSITIQDNDTTIYEGLNPIINFKGYSIDVSSSNNQIDLLFDFQNQNSLGISSSNNFTIGTSYTKVTYDTIDVSIGTSIIQNSTNTFLCQEEGLYYLNFEGTVSNTSSGTFEVVFVKNNTTQIPGSYKKINIYQDEEHILSSTVLFYANTNDEISVQIKNEDGGAILYAQYSFNIIRLSTLKGDKGDKGDRGDPGLPGSGTSIIVGDGNINNDFLADKINFLGLRTITQDNSTANITVLPTDVSINIYENDTYKGQFKKINFKGDIITSNINNDTIEIISTENVYGKEFQYVQDIAQSSTTSTTPIDKLTLNTTNLPTGNYKITVSWIGNHSSASNSMLFDILLDGTSILTSTISMEPKDITNYSPYQYSRILENISGTHIIKLQFWSESATTIISDAMIELIRVS